MYICVASVLTMVILSCHLKSMSDLNILLVSVIPCSNRCDVEKQTCHSSIWFVSVSLEYWQRLIRSTKIMTNDIFARNGANIYLKITVSQNGCRNRFQDTGFDNY